MKITTRLTSLLLGLFASLTAWADVPFTPTTITDGKFAADTKWYTLNISANKFLITDNGTASSITLKSANTEVTDAALWCFVGDDTNGYRIYNKNTGTTKTLAAPTTMSSNNGGTSYAILKSTVASSETDLWDIKATGTNTSGGGTYTVENGYLFSEHGYSSNILNNRDGKLAFWSAGHDDGSAITVTFSKCDVTIDQTTGTFTASNAAGTYFSKWQSTATAPQLTLSAPANNMWKNGTTNINYASGSAGSSVYTLTAGTDYIITGYTFKAKNADSNSNATTITAGGKDYSVTNTEQTITVSDLDEITAQFTIKGHNHAILLTDFVVSIAIASVEPEPQVDIFVTKSGTIPYRIPAIAQAKNGQLIAVADYRYSGADIGSGKLDLRYALSNDNGKTWSSYKTLVACSEYTDKSNGNLHTGFGDPCIVADRESNRVLLMSCSGDIMFTSATRDHHQGIARFYSEDGGTTWSKPTDISETIYSMFDNSKIGAAKSMFVGSGRIFQSSTVKVKDYYRLYCSVLFKDVNGTNKNYVLYSDDFGGTWSVLGGIDVAPIPSGADEPKAEELPDGSILCSSRMYGGRYYNIFHFTNSEKAEGSWGTMATSNSNNKGVIATANSCNGEVMLIPAKRKSDNKEVYLFLQSVPFGSGRANVGIYYKVLESYNDFNTPANLAKDWDGKHQASYMGSAYSTMTLQQDNTIGFLYEEETYGGSYTIVYKNYSIEQITDSLYQYNATTSKDELTKSGMEEIVSAYAAGSNVGDYTADAVAAIQAAYTAYVANPGKAAYEALNAAIAAADKVGIDVKKLYRFRNSERDNGTKYIVAGTSTMSVATLNESDKNQLFAFVPGTEDDTYYIYNENLQVYIGKAPALYAFFPMTTNQSSASLYKVQTNDSGLCALVCQDPTVSGYDALHLSGESNLVPWTSSAGASLWYIESTDIATDIAAIEADNAQGASLKAYDLTGRRLTTLPKTGVYITSDKKKHIAR